MLPYSRLTNFPVHGACYDADTRRAVPSRPFSENAGAVAGPQARLVGILTDRVRRDHAATGSERKTGGAGQDFGWPGARVEQSGGGGAPRGGQPARSVSDVSHGCCAAGCAPTYRPNSGQPCRSWNTNSRSARRRRRTWIRSSAAIAKKLSRNAWSATGWRAPGRLRPRWSMPGCEAEWFDRIAAQFPPEVLGDLLARITASLTICSLLVRD